MKTSFIRRPFATAFLLLAAFQTPLLADVLTGTNGERLVGRVLEERTDDVVFESELGGKLTIPRSRIREIQRTPAAVAPAPTEATPVATNQVAAASPAWFTLPADGNEFDWPGYPLAYYTPNR